MEKASYTQKIQILNTFKYKSKLSGSLFGNFFQNLIKNTNFISVVCDVER